MKETQGVSRYVTKLYKVVFDVWVRKTLIHPLVLLMVGLGWYLDVIGSDSHVLVRFLRIFGEKSQKEGNLENWAKKTGPFAAAKGTLALATSFVTAKGCLAAARPKGQKGHPSGSL